VSWEGYEETRRWVIEQSADALPACTADTERGKPCGDTRDNEF
jgi:hypothetical protein